MVRLLQFVNRMSNDMARRQEKMRDYHSHAVDTVRPHYGKRFKTGKFLGLCFREYGGLFMERV